MRQTAIRIAIEPAIYIPFGNIAVGYTALGRMVLGVLVPAPIEYPSRLLLFQNLTDADLWVSKDGVNDHFPITARSFLVLDIASNRNDIGKTFCMAQGTLIYVRQLGVPGSGQFCVTSFYAEGV